MADVVGGKPAQASQSPEQSYSAELDAANLEAHKKAIKSYTDAQLEYYRSGVDAAINSGSQDPYHWGLKDVVDKEIKRRGK